MVTKCIIICAGEATRWENYLGVPKHLIKIGGETIIERIVKLIHKYKQDVVDVVIVAKDNKDKRYQVNGARTVNAFLRPENLDADKFLSSSFLWSEGSRTLVIYGDVWFSEEAMEQIMAYQGKDWVLFANKKECFVQSFYPKDLEQHRKALEYVRDQHVAGKIKRCGGWEHYRAMNGTPLDKHIYDDKIILIEDLTDDFDFPWEYDEWIVRYNNENNVRS